MTTFSKENVLVLPDFLKHKNFINGKSPIFQEFGQNYSPNSWKIGTLFKENPLKLTECLKNKYFVKGKSSKNVLIPEK
jgi:hypothetical protein